MCIIAFFTNTSTRRDTLAHLGEPAAPARIAPTRGPPSVGDAGTEHGRLPIQPPAHPRPTSSTIASPSSQAPARNPSALRHGPARARCCPRLSAQPVAAENRRLTRTTASPHTQARVLAMLIL